MTQLIHSPIGKILLDAFDLQRIDPRDTWEHEQLYEFKGFAVLEQLKNLSDHSEHRENDDIQERLQQAKEQERGKQQLLQLEQCDPIDFLLLQMNQTLSYDN